MIKNGIIRYEGGQIEYWRDGKRHREDGPAMISPNGFRQWFFNDEFHRLNGPAIEFDDGTEFWYYRDVFYLRETHPFNVFRDQYDLSDVYEEWLDEYKVLFKLIYG
jgi:hypothetical protein